MSKAFATQRRYLGDIVPIQSTQNAQREGMDISGSDQDVPKTASFREILITSKPLKGCAGSANVEMGNTRVSCSVNGPKEDQSGESALEGILNVYLHGCIDQALRYTLQHALHAVVRMKKLARTEVDVELNVLSDDGGALAACLLAAGVAITSANIEMFDTLLACNVLIPLKQPENAASTQPHIILDPDQATIAAHSEESMCLTVGVIPSIGQVVCCEFGGGCPLSPALVQRVLPLAFSHCCALQPVVRVALAKNVADSAL